MDIDLSSQPVTDIHCFSFAQTRSLTRASLARLFMGGGPTVMSLKPEVSEGDLASSVAYRRMIHELSLFLNVEGTDAEVLRRRNGRARDLSRDLASLCQAARIEGLVLDNGLEPVGFEEFQRYAPARLKRVFRIEPLLKSLLERSKTFEELFGSFDERVRSAVKKEGFVGFKSVIAYRSGLDLEDSSEAEARESFGRHVRGEERMEWFGPRVKPLRDFLLRHVAERSNALGAFLQIHTGIGDTDVVATKCNPLFLKEFLKLESVMRIPVVLIHGGFPFTSEAAWLANVFPNVYFELSTPLPPTFEPALSTGRFREVVESVPVSRIVYGSDAHETPENHWLSARLAKRALGRVLGELVEQGVLDEDQARSDAGRVLSSNALELVG